MSLDPRPPVPAPPRSAAARPVFTLSPMAAKLRRAAVPMTPTAAVPVLIPIRKIGQPGWRAAMSRVTARISARGSHGPLRVVGLVTPRR